MTEDEFVDRVIELVSLAEKHEQRAAKLYETSQRLATGNLTKPTTVLRIRRAADACMRKADDLLAELEGL